jgi:transposase
VPRTAPAALDAKKKTLSASEQDPEKRAAWQEAAAAEDATGFVFIDETSTTTNLARRYARAPRGERARAALPRNYGERTTLIAALTPAGFGPAMALPGALDGEAFGVYIERVLGPVLRPGQVVIADNLSVHKNARARARIEQAGCTLRFLPAYSPDFNPIELAFAKLKEGLRAAAARTTDDLDKAIAAQLDAVTAAEARAFYRHRGYSFTEPSQGAA